MKGMRRPRLRGRRVTLWSYEEMLLNRGCAGNSMRADELNSYRFVLRVQQTRKHHRRERLHVRRRLGDRHMAEVAYLTSLFVRLMRVPVPYRLDGEEADAKNESERQRSRDESFGHSTQPADHSNANYATTLPKNSELVRKKKRAALANGHQRGARNRSESVLRWFLGRSVFDFAPRMRAAIRRNLAEAAENMPADD
jgi:hypothetical protein